MTSQIEIQNEMANKSETDYSLELIIGLLCALFVVFSLVVMIVFGLLIIVMKRRKKNRPQPSDSFNNCPSGLDNKIYQRDAIGANNGDGIHQNVFNTIAGI